MVNGEGFDENGIYKVPTTYDENDKYCKAKLDELEQVGIYNKEDNTIQIKDKNNLTEDEFNAILAVTTGNPDIYSYAAENQYHAVAYGGGHITNWNGWKNDSAIVSDVGVGESRLGWHMSVYLRAQVENSIRHKKKHMESRR